MINIRRQGLQWRPSRVFYGWWIVVSALAIDAVKHGTFNRGFTLYVLPLRTELGIGVAAISLADMFGRLAGGLLGPLAGYLTDRLGPRTMLLFGGIASGMGFILLYFTHSYLYFVLVFVGLVSLGFRSGYNNATVPALNQWFRRRRALAMSIASTGAGLGCVLLAPLIGRVFIPGMGWRASVLVSGIAIIVVVVPLSFLVRRSPESMGLMPDGDRVPTTPVSPTAEQLRVRVGEREFHDATNVRTRPRESYGDADFTVREAMTSISYWLLVWAVGLRNTVHSGMSFLLAPVMVWFLQGAGRDEDGSLPIAALFIGALCFGTLVFNPLVGWIGDSWSKQKLSAVAMVSGMLALLVILNQGGHLWQLGLFASLLAFSESANPLAWAIMGDFFGRRNFATLRGWQHLPDQLMSMATPVWMGLIADHTGSYKWALMPLMAIYGLSAIFYWTIPRPKAPARLRARSAAGGGVFP